MTDPVLLIAAWLDSDHVGENRAAEAVRERAAEVREVLASGVVPEFHCEVCGSGTHDTFVHGDTPVLVPAGFLTGPVTDESGCGGKHRGPEGPNEDMSVCESCGSPTYAMRPENETIGLHDDGCSLPIRHESFCAPGGKGHPPAEVIRGFWPGMDADVAAARARWKFPGCDPDCAERDACTSTSEGHRMCGHCPDHDQPRHHCAIECRR